MVKVFKTLAVLVSSIALLGGTTALADDFDMDKASELFEVKCAKCHSVERPKGKNKNKEDWSATVKRMQTKSPGWFTDEEAKILIEYLSKAHGQ